MILTKEKKEKQVIDIYFNEKNPIDIYLKY